MMRGLSPVVYKSMFPPSVFKFVCMILTSTAELASMHASEQGWIYWNAPLSILYWTYKKYLL